MGDRSKIEWTDRTDNPIRARNLETGNIGHFCEKITPGCAHCYAERRQPRFKNPIRFEPQFRGKVELILDRELLRKIPHRRKPCKIFPCDMTDMFGPWVPDDWLDEIMAAYACLDRQFAVQFLTKRADRMLAYFSSPDRMKRIAVAGLTLGVPSFRTDQWPLPHFWLGVSPNNQKSADTLIPLLLQTPAAVRFVSEEPSLGQIKRLPYLETGLLHWWIWGGESGPGARPSHPDNARAARDECQAAGVPFLFKQRGEWTWDGDGEAQALICNRGTFRDFKRPLKQKDWTETQHAHQGHGDCKPYALGRLGKKRAGRLLDGREWNEFPASVQKLDGIR